jgi:hypothetical protein
MVTTKNTSTKKVPIKLFPSNDIHYVEIQNLVKIYHTCLVQYNHRVGLYLPSNLRSTKVWNHYYKLHLFLKSKGYSPQEYVENIFQYFYQCFNNIKPHIHALIGLEDRYLEQVRKNKKTYHAFYKESDNITTVIIREIGRGLFTYLKLKISNSITLGQDLTETQIMTLYPAQFDDYSLIFNDALATELMRDKKLVKNLLNINRPPFLVKLEEQYTSNSYTAYLKVKEDLYSRIDKEIEKYLDSFVQDFIVTLDFIQTKFEKLNYQF